MSDKRHFAVEPDAPVYSRGIRIKRLHLLRESLLAAAATVDEHPVVPLAQQADRLAAQLLGIGLPRLGRKRRETDPHAPLLPHRIRPFAPDGRGRIREFEPQPAERVAIADDGVLERHGTGVAALQAHPLLQMGLVDVGRLHAVHPHRQPEALRPPHVVHVRHTVHAHAADPFGQCEHAAHGVVFVARVDVEKIHVQPLEKGAEQRQSRHRNLQVRIGRHQRAQGVRQHRHIAHGRRADDQKMTGQRSTSTWHTARG